LKFSVFSVTSVAKGFKFFAFQEAA
jgi:hypothetical protein